MRWRLLLVASIITVLAVGTNALQSSAQVPMQGSPDSKQPSETDTPIAPNTVTAYGNATAFGPLQSLIPAANLVDMSALPDESGYWVAGADGGVYSYGATQFYGSMGAHPLNAPVTGIAATPAGRGYWLVAEDGGVFSFGDARFAGSAGSIPLNAPIVSMAITPSGNGYWLFSTDGGVFAYGDAGFFGSMGGSPINGRIVDGDATVTGNGYWLAAEDGGVFSFGDATFMGSEGGTGTDTPVTGFSTATSGDGYVMNTRSGQVYAYGVYDRGSANTSAGLAQPQTVAIEAGRNGYWLLHGEFPVPEVSDRGPQIEALQQRLTSLGYWLGSIDGAYGPLTQQAVYAFDKVEGLPRDGSVDLVTAGRLNVAVRPAPRNTDGDRMEVDKTRQVVFAVQSGRVAWTFNASTGTEQPYFYESQKFLADTPIGDGTIFWQVDGVHISHLGRLYRPKFFDSDGIAIHGYSHVPPYPASHGCVRVSNDAMDFIWDSALAPVHSIVSVYD